MNWYKIAQQQYYLDFYDPKIDPELEKENMFFKDRHRVLTEIDIKELIEEDMVQNEQELVYALENQGINYEKVSDFPSADPIYVIHDKETFVIEKTGEYFNIKEGKEWITDLSDIELISYVGQDQEDFWDQVGENDKLYHGTTKDNLDKILQEGLKPQGETRGVLNRSTPDAIFLSSTPEPADSFYDVVLEIDIGQMKQDGITPTAGEEEPAEESRLREALADKIGLSNYEIDYIREESMPPGEGIDPDTVVMYDPIPPKYIRVVKFDNEINKL